MVRDGARPSLARAFAFSRADSVGVFLPGDDAAGTAGGDWSINLFDLRVNGVQRSGTEQLANAALVALG